MRASGRVADAARPRDPGGAGTVPEGAPAGQAPDGAAREPASTETAIRRLLVSADSPPSFAGRVLAATVRGGGAVVAVLADGGSVAHRQLERARRVALLGDGSPVFGYADGSLRIGGRERLPAHRGAVAALAARTPAGRTGQGQGAAATLVASAGLEGDVRLWLATAGGLDPAGDIAGDGHPGLVALAIDSTGTRLAVARLPAPALGGEEGEPGPVAPPPWAAVHAIRAGRLDAEPAAVFFDLPPIVGVAFLPDGALAAGLLDGGIAVLRAAEPPRLVPAFAGALECLVATSEGAILSAGDDRVSRRTRPGEARQAGEEVLAADEDETLLRPSRPERRLRALDAAALARGLAADVPLPAGF